MTNICPPSDKLPTINAAVAGTSGSHHDENHNHARARQVGLSGKTVSNHHGGERTASCSPAFRQTQWDFRSDLLRHTSRPWDSEAGGKVAEKKESVEAATRTIRRVTRNKYSAEEKVRIVLEGLRGETSIAALCWRDGITSF